MAHVIRITIALSSRAKRDYALRATIGELTME